MSLWDDLQKFGSGIIEDVGEGVDSLIDGWVDDQSANPATTQQPHTSHSDQYGNKQVPYHSPTMPLSAYLTPRNVAMGVGGVVVLMLGCDH
ncbi:hypothetical protein [Vibrio nigripulchritudo]|uniref:hypothetical protein n=1 Tax=Vibrio nigripulchritudo TaxID=28173 RepID=UPI0024916A98|nr:hypothetical protein [Vibrio nigripulchritudo]BDU46897.1 hypothetical protein TUMSATVNIG3_56950 [Vibrio nigripulchritudo]